MIKIAICEDSIVDLKLLKKIVSKLLEDKKCDYCIDLYEQGEELLDKYNNNPYDLVFLDIMMGKINGLEVGKILRHEDKIVEIIYCTSNKDFAIEAYEIQALGYLLKPYEIDKIGKFIDYFLLKHPQNQEGFIEVKSKRKNRIIAYDDIIYIESDNKVIYINTRTNGVVKVYQKLDDIENQILDERFLRCHQSYYVNMAYIKRCVQSDFVMDSDDIVPIRKSGRKIIVKTYENYLKNSILEDNN